jgi:hypothetical protein
VLKQFSILRKRPVNYLQVHDLLRQAHMLISFHENTYSVALVKNSRLAYNLAVFKPETVERHVRKPNVLPNIVWKQAWPDGIAPRDGNTSILHRQSLLSASLRELQLV